MPAILIECLFADSDDTAFYDPEVIARSIGEGLVGVEDFSNGEFKLGWNHNNVGWWYCTCLENESYYSSKDGWQEIGNEWYIFNDKGYALQNSWYHDENNNAWYYLNDECKMVRGSKDKILWLWIDSSCYAFGEDGKMYRDCVTPDNYRVDGSGAWVDKKD